MGEPLFCAAAEASALVAMRLGLTTTVVAGPFLPGPAWRWLQGRARRSSTIEVVRRVQDLSLEMARSTLSVSQCGYNTSMDILRSATPSVVVPYSAGQENEQARRAERLAALGAVRTIPADQLDGNRLAVELDDLSRFRPQAVTLDLTGAETSARIVAGIAGLDPTGLSSPDAVVA